MMHKRLFLLMLLLSSASTTFLTSIVHSQSNTTRFLSSLLWTSATNGLGPVERDQTNGGAAAQDGSQIRLDGVPYDHGLGVSAESDISYALSGNCSSFSAIAGMDDSADQRSKAVLVIYLDGQMIFSTDEVSKGNPATRLSFSVAGVQTLRLRVTSYDATDGDLVSWANARITCTDGATVPTATATPTRIPVTPPPATATATPTRPPGQRFVLPGTIQAENASGFTELDPITTGVYRSDGLDVERCTGCGNGYTLGAIQNGEAIWFDVQFSQATSYLIQLRAATPNLGRQVAISLNGSQVGQLALPATGSWQTYALTSGARFTPPIGNSTLRLDFPTGALNLDSITIVAEGAAASPTPPAPTGTATPTATTGPTATPQPTPTPPIGDGGITSNAPQWGRWEQQLTASQSSHNPVTDVALRITYSGPNGQTFQSQGFWDGGSTFVVRAMFPTIGTWTWQTQATSGDSGLTQHGTVQVSAGTGTTLQTNGALKISSDGHNLTYADGTHFFWLGDTVWDAPLRASETEWQQYLRDRTSKGFSVVQISLAPTWSAANDVQGNRPFVNDDLRRPNPTFWQMFDRKVQLANDAGLAVLVVGLMDPLDQGQSDYAVAQLMGRYIAARLAGNHVIFSPSFDLPYWDMADETAKAIREVAPNHLITQHPGTPSGQPTNVWSEQYFAQPYLNIAGLQTGHNGGDRNLVFGQAVTWTRSLAQRQPAKTVINLEAYYDTGGLVSDGGGAHQGTAWDARATAYLSLLSGASGYTYGAYGIYIWNGKPFHPLPWQTALNFDSSRQMTILRTTFTSLPWWQLRPAPERVLTQTGDPTSQAVLAITSDGTAGMAYLPSATPVQIDMGGFSRTLQASWVNPVTSARTVIGSVTNGGSRTFTPPAGGTDWMLLFQ